MTRCFSTCCTIGRRARRCARRSSSTMPTRCTASPTTKSAGHDLHTRTPPCGACQTVIAGNRRTTMTIGMILLIITVLLLLGAVPAWPYSRGWGYAPSGGLGLLLLILLVLLLLGRL